MGLSSQAEMEGGLVGISLKAELFIIDRIKERGSHCLQLCVHW